MKRVYIVTYDLSNPGRNYESLLKIMKAKTAWARLGGSSYLVLTELNATQLRDKLSIVLDNNDSLYVGLMGNSAAWRWLGDNVSNWIKNNQK